MKTCVLILLTAFSMHMAAQDVHLHCGKIIDTENGKILTQKNHCGLRKNNNLYFRWLHGHFKF